MSAHYADGCVSSLREACILRSTSPENNDCFCGINMCTNDEDIFDCLLSSDDHHKIVAAIGDVQAFLNNAFKMTLMFVSFSAAIVSNFATVAKFEVLKVLPRMAFHAFYSNQHFAGNGFAVLQIR